MTSAPRSARICVANGPMMTVVRSRTRTPVRGPSLNVGAEVNVGLPDVELRRSILDYQLKIFDRGDHREKNCKRTQSRFSNVSRALRVLCGSRSGLSVHRQRCYPPTSIGHNASPP